MADKQPTVDGRRRSKGAGASGRAEALQKLKARRDGGNSSLAGFAIKVDDPIYDTVDDAQYSEIVSKRGNDFKSFIVDDNGLGYQDLGEEEDWSKSEYPLSSSESDGEPDKSKKKKGVKKSTSSKKSSPLSAPVSMGKQRISSMFTSNFPKSSDDKVKGLSCEHHLDDVIASFEPNKADKPRQTLKMGLSSTTKGLCSSGHDIIRKLPVHTITSSYRSESVTPLDHSLLDSPLTDEKKVPSESDNVEGLDLKLGSHPISPTHNSLPNEFSVEENFQNESMLEDRIPNDVKSEEVQKVEKVNVFNAKVNNNMDPAMSATAGWLLVKYGDKAETGCDGVVGNYGTSEEKLDFELQPDGSFPLYLLDAYEEIFNANMGKIYLFGKVKSGGAYRSCCVIVKNMQRCVYAVPKSSIFSNDVVRKLEEDANGSHMSTADICAKLQSLSISLKNELAKHLLDLNVSSYCMAPVKRNYAFERFDVPSGENYFLKINYPFKDPPLPLDLKGENFCALLGTHCSALELFLIKRKIKGPSWISISNFSCYPAAQRVSLCKFELTVDSPKCIRPLSSANSVEIPPLVVTSINLKSIINEKENINEIVSASVISRDGLIDDPMLTSQCTGMLTHFTVMRYPEGSKTPMVARQVDEKITLGKLNVIIEINERALLSRLMAELFKLDSDIFVGHNISGFDLDILLNRAKACNLPSSVWSKIGRLKRSFMPKIAKGFTIFGSGASVGILSCVAGRLLCDTFLSSRDILKEVTYSLSGLAKTQLNKDRKEISVHDIPKMFQSSDSFFQLVECGETDAWLSMELMFHLNILPLTRQLTNISGNLWGKTLQGARAQRVEYLLLHAFHARKYIVPDKFPHGKVAKVEKRKVKDCRGSDDLNIDYDDFENSSNHHQKGKKGPTYSGGLVLDPKSGLYDKFVLVLDFNSLYPSIIQEYNICFTTVEKSVDELIPTLPSSRINGVLPELLKDLVERRKMVKTWLKSASVQKARQFEVQQQALKLTANSMYGCLGFSNSRFYAKPLAELITLQGREILQNTVELVQNNLNLEVIYGDTDSIMIYSGLDDIAKANEIARKVIQEVNKKYKKLEIDLDGLYKRMLLLKKKKYAAVKVLFKNGVPYEVIERKGLDMVRRDWSPLSKDLGDFCLGQILSGGSCEEVVESIHDSLRKIQDDMKKGLVALEKYIITKSLTKPPEAYPDKNQPHVQVALRLMQSGLSNGCGVGDTIPYIICCDQGTGSSSSTGIAYRARHPDELKQDKGIWMIDIDYYLSQQIHPVVSRLCASIQGTSPACLAECLGLDSSKFQNITAEVTRNDESSYLFAIDESERYHGCKALVLTCPRCRSKFECPPIYTSLCSSVNEKAKESMPSFWDKLCCLRCPMEGDLGRMSPSLIANQVKRQARGFISTYYKFAMTCDDISCNHACRKVNLRVVGDSERGSVCPKYPQCNGRLVRKYTEANLYKQLSYFCYILDTDRCMDKVEKMGLNARMELGKELYRIRGVVREAASIAEAIRDRCFYGWVQLDDFFD